jgi:peptidylprolyl isomerase
MMKNTVCSFSFLLLTAVLPLTAQTTAPKTTTAAHGASAGTHHAAGGCVMTPPLSPKIPALPASAPCVKTLYTVTRMPEMKLDYASPLVSASVRSELGGGPATFSLDYVDTKAGTGGPVEQHKCISVQYTGYLLDGTKFDSSRDRPGSAPIEFLYGGHRVIPGWDTGFEGMRMGGERRLFIPYELAYGESGRGPIPPKAELIFDVEAVSQSSPREGGPPGGECSKAPVPQGRPMMPPSGRPNPPAGTPHAGTPPAGNAAPATPAAGSTPPQSTPPATKPQG